MRNFAVYTSIVWEIEILAGYEAHLRMNTNFSRITLKEKTTLENLA